MAGALRPSLKGSVLTLSTINTCWKQRHCSFPSFALIQIYYTIPAFNILNSTIESQQTMPVTRSELKKPAPVPTSRILSTCLPLYLY